jgi:L-ascorbate metabolism protein UlaG (beta-lactamase superfamily)
MMAITGSRSVKSTSPTESPRAAITWLGHATALIEIDGVRLLTDPVLRDRVGPLVRVAQEVQTEALGQLDCVLLSHLHSDHAHLSSLRKLARSTPILAPRGAARWLYRHGLRAVSELAAGEQTSVEGLQVRATPAVHEARRRPFGPQAEPIGYVVRGSRSVYFAGDTDLFEAMSDLEGAVDLALLPVWGWGPRLGPGHLDPERAARAAAIIAPAIAIPIHWGTLAPGWRRHRSVDLQRPAREFAAHANRYAPRVQVRLLAPGERTEL